MISTMRRLMFDDRGATLVEYGLLLALIALACIASMGSLGTAINSMFQADANDI